MPVLELLLPTLLSLWHFPLSNHTSFPNRPNIFSTNPEIFQISSKNMNFNRCNTYGTNPFSNQSRHFSFQRCVTIYHVGRHFDSSEFGVFSGLILKFKTSIERHSFALDCSTRCNEINGWRWFSTILNQFLCIFLFCYIPCFRELIDDFIVGRR